MNLEDEIENFLNKEEEVGPQPLLFVRPLFNSWSNEKRAPELLRFDASAVSQAKVFLADRSTEALAGLPVDIRDIYQLDVDRVAYVLKSYLRLRLFKLQKYYHYYLASETEKLSASERRFAERMAALNKAHMHTAFLHCLPEEEVFQSISTDKMVRKPDIRGFVFARVLQSAGTIMCGSGEESFELLVEKGKTYLARYCDVMMLVEQQKMVLI